MNSASLLAEYCKTHLDFSTLELPSDYGYAHLPLCVIDAVFSIGVKYASVKNTIARFCDFAGIFPTGTLLPAEQLSISDFILLHESNGTHSMAREVYQNRQRTSTRNGILKADAVYRFAKILAQFGAETLAEVPRIHRFPDFESEIKTIPGQRSGVSLQYFYMLTGDEHTIKPDRMVARFIEQATNHRYNPESMKNLVIETCDLLQSDFPHLTPRTLDQLIWGYQSQR
ncbi:MAG: hypothetical protein H6636_00020 [Anaerolineales bacterium]|nr:hypothetical protein [Anaerolineales bacterium]